MKVWLILLIVFLAGYVVINQSPAEVSPSTPQEVIVIGDDNSEDTAPVEDVNVALQKCTRDTDCIPNPEQCHPTTCINRRRESLFNRPGACTQEFRAEAAYNEDDCGCLANRCENLNKGNTLPEERTPPRVPDETELGQVDCTAVQRDAEVCPTLYAPVCGWFDSSIQCVTYPCAQEYSNSCEACRAAQVEYYTEGQCPTG